MLLSMAWRNLWRRRRRTLITLSSIAFGTMLSWLFTGVGDANWRAMIDLAARLGGGHVALQHPAYLVSPALSRSLPSAESLRARALNDPEVLRAAPRISGQMMLASAARNYGAVFIAFDPALEDATTLSLLDAMHAEAGADPRAALFDARGRGGIALGARLAERLNVGIGDKVVWTLTDKQGEIVQEALRVRALLRSGSPGVDGATSSANTTWAWALISFAVHQYVGIRAHGFRYIHHFLGPVLFDAKLLGRTIHVRPLAPIYFIIEAISHLSRVFTLAVRLLANMFADHQVVAVWLLLLPAVVPAVFMGLGVLVAFLQAYVFALLSMIYIGLALEEAH